MSIEVNVTEEPNVFNVTVHDGNITPTTATEFISGYDNPSEVEVIPTNPEADAVYLQYPSFTLYRWIPGDYNWEYEASPPPSTQILNGIYNPNDQNIVPENPNALYIHLPGPTFWAWLPEGGEWEDLTYNPL